MVNFDSTLLMHRLAHYSGPAELHLTVELGNGAVEKSRFKEACRAQNGKSIWIELDKGHCINQPMFGVRMSSSAQEQADEIQMLVSEFSKGFLIRRIKVEAGPNNKNIPQSSLAALNEPADCYFEHHVALGLKADVDLEHLKSELALYHGYLSRNAFKTAPQSREQIRFVTQRFSKMSQMDADAKLGKLINYARQERLSIIDTEREYNIFDSNLHLDRGWMS
ncbi:MAG: hypothetical protein ABJN69_07650 [Hellea sp.]